MNNKTKIKKKRKSLKKKKKETWEQPIGNRRK
jgi:hypothetical protein